MWKKIAAVGILTALAGCGTTVLGTLGDEKELYRGTATPGVMRSGSITMSNSTGRVCNGTYHYLNGDISIRLIPLVGVAAIRCNDGMTANMKFRSITQYSGWGVGKTSKGTKISFVFGMSEDEARMYLDLPEQSVEGDLPVAGGGGNGQPKPATTAQAPSGDVREIAVGSGFFISDQGHILTNNHVVQGCDYMQVKQADGTQQRAETLFTDTLNDLAVIKVANKPTDIATFPPATAYRVGDDVLAFGFALGDDLSKSGVLTTGTIGALSGLNDDSRFIQITASIQHGNSGGPLSDKMGNVIGVNTMGLNPLWYVKNKGILPESANFAVKELVVKTFLKAHSVPFVETNKTQAQSNADIGEQMRKYTVRAGCYGRPKKEASKS